MSGVSCPEYVEGGRLCVLDKRTAGPAIIQRVSHSASNFLLWLICLGSAQPLPDFSKMPLSSAWVVLLWEVCFSPWEIPEHRDYTVSPGRAVCAETQGVASRPEKA